jgi:hypothetical protein
VICRLIASPKAAVSVIGRQLKPVAIDRARVRRLLTDLNSDRYETRQRAESQLAELGSDIETEIRQAMNAKPSLEVYRRLERLLRASSPAAPRNVQRTRALEVLEHIATPEAVALLKKLAAGVPGSRLTREARESVERLERGRLTIRAGPSR